MVTFVLRTNLQPFLYSHSIVNFCETMTLSDRIILYDSQGSGQCPHWERTYYIKLSYFGGLRTGIASELTCCSSRCDSLERQLCRLGGWSQTSWIVQQIGNSAQTVKCTEKWSPELSDREPTSSTKSNWSLVTWGKQVDQLQQSYNYHSVLWSQGLSGFSRLFGVYRHVIPVQHYYLAGFQAMKTDLPRV